MGILSEERMEVEAQRMSLFGFMGQSWVQSSRPVVGRVIKAVLRMGDGLGMLCAVSSPEGADHFQYMSSMPLW